LLGFIELIGLLGLFGLNHHQVLELNKHNKLNGPYKPNRLNEPKKRLVPYLILTLCAKRFAPGGLDRINHIRKLTIVNKVSQSQDSNAQTKSK
jgi:hypothetical protein